MKRVNFPRKKIVLLSVFVPVILFAVFRLGVAAGSNAYRGTGVITTYEGEETPLEEQRHKKELEVRKLLSDYDKENIVMTSIYLGTSEDKITSVSILIFCKGEILADRVRQEEVKRLVAENLNLDAKEVEIEYEDFQALNSSSPESK